MKFQKAAADLNHSNIHESHRHLYIEHYITNNICKDEVKMAKTQRNRTRGRG